MPARFALGQLLATPGALAALATSNQSPAQFLARHESGDWGECLEEDRRFNDDATANEADPDRRGRVLSAYRTHAGTRLWVITEQDRSATTILLPEEY